MSKVNVSIDEAAVTRITEFHSHQGYGLDIFIEAKSSTCTVYLQVVLYDDRARDAFNRIHVGDSLKISGPLKVKNYVKSDGTDGWSLVLENPEPFHVIQNRNNKPQLLLTDIVDNAKEETKHVMAEAAQPSMNMTDEWDDGFLWDDSSTNAEDCPADDDNMPF